MVEFNPDGSLKLPDRFVRKQKADEERMTRGRCMRVRKEVMSFEPPKRCALNLILSGSINDTRFMSTIYGYFAQKAETPTRFSQTGPNEFRIEIGTAFRRCTECCTLVGRYREFLDGNLIEEKGECSFSPRPFFCNDDYY